MPWAPKAINPVSTEAHETAHYFQWKYDLTLPFFFSFSTYLYMQRKHSMESLKHND